MNRKLDKNVDKNAGKLLRAMEREKAERAYMREKHSLYKLLKAQIIGIGEYRRRFRELGREHGKG